MRSVRYRFGSTDYVEFGKNAFHVRLHGAFTNKESRANFLVALSLRHQLEHIDFASAQSCAADAFRELGSDVHGYAEFRQHARGECNPSRLRVAHLCLHLESTVLADKFEFGFMESVETQFEEILVAEAEGTGEQAADFSVDTFHFSTGEPGFVIA